MKDERDRPSREAKAKLTSDKRDAAKMIGRRVVAVHLHEFLDDRISLDGKGSGYAYAPEIIFDDGTRLTFRTQEIDCGSEYGTELCVIAPRKGT
jgi:hypothetical protein